VCNAARTSISWLGGIGPAQSWKVRQVRALTGLAHDGHENDPRLAHSSQNVKPQHVALCAHPWGCFPQLLHRRLVMVLIGFCSRVLRRRAGFAVASFAAA
jgi:hypothetical protein